MVSLGAFAGSLVLSGLALVVLRRFQVLDIPNSRSLHSQPTVRGGGAGAAAAGLAAVALIATSFGDLAGGLGAAAGGVAALGLVDDLRSAPVGVRFGFQALVAVLAAQLLVDGGLGLLWAPVLAATAWLVTYLNAFNFMDGINGISSFQVIAAGATWLVAGQVSELPALATSGAVAVALALGFLPFNFPRAKMFLGDAGSYFFGGWLAATAAWAVLKGVPPEAVVAPLALYLLDTGLTLARRIARGESWLQPHKTHIYQRLVALGWSHTRVALFCGAAMAACGVLGLVSLSGSTAQRGLAGVGICAVLAGYAASPHLKARHPSTVAR